LPATVRVKLVVEDASGIRRAFDAPGADHAAS
jgi:hypothetical protein